MKSSFHETEHESFEEIHSFIVSKIEHWLRLNNVSSFLTKFGICFFK